MEEVNKFSKRFKRYTDLGTSAGSLAVKFLGTKILGKEKSKNAENFNFDKSLVLLRVNNKDYAMQVSKTLDTPSNEIIEKIDYSLDCDVTVIIGKDYNQLSSFDSVIELSPPY